MIDATRQMGHAGHRRRLLAARPQRGRSGGRRHRPTTRRERRPFSAAIDVAPAINPLTSTIAVNRADGVTRAIVAPQRRAQHLRRPGRGDRPRRRHGPDHRARAASSSSSWARPAPTTAGGSRASAHVLFRNALREAAELQPLRRAGFVDAAREAMPDEPIVRDPNESRLIGPDARRSEDVLLTRFDAAALVPVLQGRQYLLVHVERASDILQVICLEARIPGAQAGARRRDRRLDASPTRSPRPASR